MDIISEKKLFSAQIPDSTGVQKAPRFELILQKEHKILENHVYELNICHLLVFIMN